MAGYIAKYATKATESFGAGIDQRLTAADDLEHLDKLPAHVAELVRACWELGSRPELDSLRLRAWAHMLGFGGHWSTRSRRYSTIVTVLRRARVAFAKRRQARHGTPSMLCPQGRRAAVPDRDGEQQAQGRLDERFWLLAVKTAGLDGLRIHDLRHTAVALWIAAGANPKEVAARAGHASVSFTLDRHGHLYPEADLNLRERLDAIWSAAEADRERLRPQRDLTCCGSRHEGRTAR